MTPLPICWAREGGPEAWRSRMPVITITRRPCAAKGGTFFVCHRAVPYPSSPAGLSGPLPTQSAGAWEALVRPCWLRPCKAPRPPRRPSPWCSPSLLRRVSGDQASRTVVGHGPDRLACF